MRIAITHLLAACLARRGDAYAMRSGIAWILTLATSDEHERKSRIGEIASRKRFNNERGNNMKNKYELTDETINLCGITLHRIRALRDTPSAGVKSGDLGGWIEKESNLCQNGNAWVYGDAWVYDNARVYDTARVYDNAWVYGDAKVCGDEDYMVIKNTWSSGRWFTYTRSNKMWKVGCFYGSGDELIKKAYADSELSGKCYEAIVRAVETIEAAKAKAKGEMK